MTEYNVGDKVMLAKPHLYCGKPYTTEAEVGMTGVVINAHEQDITYVLVKWDNPRDRVEDSNVDLVCLVPAIDPASVRTIDQVETFLDRDAELFDVEAFLNG